MQVPGFTIVTVKPDTVHTPVVDEVTVAIKPESNQTFIVKVDLEKARSLTRSPMKFC